MSNPISIENALTGTSAWDIRSNIATIEIQAYADQQSLDAGSTLNFFVSTQAASTTYTMTIFRLGWYGGTGGCLKYTSAVQIGIAQGYWNEGNQTLTNCPTAIIDNSTHLIDAGWTSTDSWTVPSNAVTGMYVAVFTDANNKATQVTFVVRGNATADYLVSHPCTTDAAYNDWGGWSLYTNPTVGVKVSFNRPQSVYVLGGQTLGWAVFAYEIQAIHWLESQGYDLSYICILDLHTTPGITLTHKAYISLGHDEYWTYAMRAEVESAASHHKGLAFLGANACYWQCRLEADSTGNANRTVVCYKVEKALNNYANDPQYGADNTKVTTLWRDPLLRRPENMLAGIMFYDDTHGSNAAWTVDTNATSSFLTGTGLTPGQSYGTDIVGYEWDNIFPSPPGPNNVQIIGTSSQTGVAFGASKSNTITYINPGGGLVFASGSMSWANCLDTYRWSGATPAVVAGMQTLFANILATLIVVPPSVSFSMVQV